MVAYLKCVERGPCDCEHVEGEFLRGMFEEVKEIIVRSLPIGRQQQLHKKHLKRRSMESASRSYAMTRRTRACASNFHQLYRMI